MGEHTTRVPLTVNKERLIETTKILHDAEGGKDEDDKLIASARSVEG